MDGIIKESRAPIDIVLRPCMPQDSPGAPLPILSGSSAIPKIPHANNQRSEISQHQVTGYLLVQLYYSHRKCKVSVIQVQ
jgi:hypothetical protein